MKPEMAVQRTPASAATPRDAPEGDTIRVKMTPLVNQHLTKATFAHQELRRMIIEGELKPGERLLLRSLADEMDLSIQPIRDAIKLLERDGLVQTESHRGAVVTQISSSTIVELISVRMWLEILAVEQAVPLHDERSIAQVEAALADADATLHSDRDGLSYSQANRRLHEAIERPAPLHVRELISETWDNMWRVRRQMSLFTIEASAAPISQTEHETLVAAVADGDIAGAVVAMTKHRQSTLRHWERAAVTINANYDAAAGV